MFDPDAINAQRIRTDLSSIHLAPNNAEAMILVPGAMTEIPAYTVKVHAKYPNNPLGGLPSIQGVIQLFDSGTGALLAIIDSPIVTGHRTAAANAVAVDELAREDATTVAIIGAGFQGEMQFRYLRHIRSIDTVYYIEHCKLVMRKPVTR